MYKWYLPTLSEIIALGEPIGLGEGRSPAQQQLRAEREWNGAIAALKQLLQDVLESDAPKSAAHCARSRAKTKRAAAKRTIQPEATQGILLSGPFPILDQPSLLANFAAWTFTVGTPGEMPLQLLPAANSKGAVTDVAIPTLPLLSSDPLAAEQFCLALTAEFSAVVVLGEAPTGESAFLFSFDPEVVQQAWRSLQARLRMTAPYALPSLESLVERFAPKAPSYQTVSKFSRLLLACLPHPSDLEEKSVPAAGQMLQGVASSLTPQASPEAVPVASPVPRSASKASGLKSILTSGKPEAGPDSKLEKRAESSFDTDLLKAIAHEIRTPLTTIRTLTRLLLRRKELSPDVIKRLEVIDRECTEQIDRFSLIFRAVELETATGKSALTSLAPISLSQVLQQTVPRWQQQANLHSHTLNVDLPQKLPMVVTDPTMLDQVLTGLVDRFTHSLPPGSHIQMQVSQAGHQLKLQLESHPQTHASESDQGKSKFGFTPTLKSLGQLLTFQPETGNLSLNMAVTKNLFQALGGKLIVKQRPHQGEVLTIFLPLESRKVDD